MQRTTVSESQDVLDYLAWLVDLRTRLRGAPEGRAIVNRCLQLIARAADERDPATQAELDKEVRRLAEDLALRFGAPKSQILH